MLKFQTLIQPKVYLPILPIPWPCCFAAGKNKIPISILMIGSQNSIEKVRKKCERLRKKALRWNVLFFFDAHAVLFTVRIWGASSYETRRANDTASILVLINLLKATDLPSMAIGNSLFQMFCHVRNESYWIIFTRQHTWRSKADTCCGRRYQRCCEHVTTPPTPVTTVPTPPCKDCCKDPPTFGGHNGKPVENISKSFKHRKI